MEKDLSCGACEHCQREFKYWLLHCGFGDCVFAYCDSCGMPAILSLWDKRMLSLPNCPGQQEICSAMESFIEPCPCGGRFRRGAAPRCPHCNCPLSAELATTYIETNAPGTKKGWRWQKNWSGVYCMVVEDKKIDNNFRSM